MLRYFAWLRTHQVFYSLLILASVLILSAGAISWINSQSALKAVESSQQSARVIAQSERLIGVMGNSESFGLRWMMANQQGFLDSYRAEMDQLDAEIASLAFLLQADRSQSERMMQVAELARSRRAWHEETIRQFAEAPNRDAALDVVAERVALRTGADLMVGITNTVQNVLVEARQQRDENDAAATQRMSRASTTVVVANLLALLAGALGFAATWQSRQSWIKEREVAWKKERAEAASQQKSLFLATMSHEIRTPMNAIFGFSQLLSRQISDPKAMAYVRAIRASGQSLLALINDLLDLSKIEAGRMELHLVPTDLHELAESTILVFSEAAADKQLALSVDIDPVLPRTLLIDPHRFRQIMVNLISNAVKYTEQGSIHVSLTSVQAGAGRVSLTLTVADTGVGIDPDQVDSIFDPFHRTASAEVSRIEGTGLGLSIVQRLVDLMHGEIALETRLNAGSRFTVSFPSIAVARRVKEPPPYRMTEMSFANLRPSRILIVDDVPLNRELIHAYLMDSGHTLTFAEDGEQAVNMAADWKPDVVLMDIRMPRLDGRKAAERIRKARGDQSIVIVAVTASSMTGDERSQRQLFDAYLRKPVAVQELYDCLAQLVPRREGALSDELSKDVPAMLDASVMTAVPAALNPPCDPATPEVVAALDEVLRVQWPKARPAMRASAVRQVLDQLQTLLPRCGEAEWTASLDEAVNAMEGFRVEEVERSLDRLAAAVAHRHKA